MSHALLRVRFGALRLFHVAGVFAALPALLVCAVGARAGVLHDESVDGDLSGDRLAPTAYDLAPGGNLVRATSVQGDREYVALTVPAGRSLDALIMVNYTGLDEVGFIGVQAGSTFTEPPQGTNVANLLGWTHFGTAVFAPGDNMLPDLGTGPGSIGFAPPLPAGTYTFWIQQTGTNPADYTLDFVISPAPGAAGLAALGALALSRRRR